MQNIIFKLIIKNKAISGFFMLAVFFIVFATLFLAQSVTAEYACEQSQINITARDAQGRLVPGMSYSVYKQIQDANGNYKPGNLVASGRIDDISGRGSAIFNTGDYRGMYVLKMWDKNSDLGAFWFYDNPTVSCGQTINIEKTLSAVKLTLRDASGELKKNTQFKIYAQTYDADGQPIADINKLISVLNSGTTGQATIYLPDRDHLITARNNNYYLLEVINSNNGKFYLYNINVNSGRVTEVNYYLSDVKFILKDANNVSYPANTRIGVYKQDLNAGNTKITGAHIIDVATNDAGEAILEYPAGTYAAVITGVNNQKQYFWDINIVSQQRKIYTLKDSSTWDPASGVCAATSVLEMETRNLDGTLIPNMYYEIYEQISDINSRPTLGRKVAGNVIDGSGRAEYIFHPDPRKKYAINIYEKNRYAGNFLFYNQVQFQCAEYKKIVMRLPFVKIILRDGDGHLLRDQKFTIYKQKRDVDGQPVREREDLVTNYSTDATGSAIIYLTALNSYDHKGGSYVFSATKGRVEFVEYNLNVFQNQNTAFEYKFSDVVLEIKNAAGKSQEGKMVDLHQQNKNLAGQNILGTKLLAGKIDSSSKAKIEYPAGTYAAVIKDDTNRNIIFWDIKIENRQRRAQTLITNLTKLYAKDSAGADMSAGTQISIYELKKDGAGQYSQDRRIDVIALAESGLAEISLASGPHLFTIQENRIEYGVPFMIENGKIQSITIAAAPENKVFTGKKYSLVQVKGIDNELIARLQGYILLQVEGHGEAWYLDPESWRRYYLSNGYAAYEIMRSLGLGITNENLSKIPIGVDARFNVNDSDGDGLADKMEEAIGTDKYDADTDGDGHKDGLEVKNNYNPNGPGKMKIDHSLTERLKGRILLQVKSRGEAWYINPKDGRRYYMADGDSAYMIMRYLSLGITNDDLDKIPASN